MMQSVVQSRIGGLLFWMWFALSWPVACGEGRANVSGTVTVNGSPQSSPGGSFAVEPRSTAGYPRGTSVTLRAIPKPGYRFAYWTGDIGGFENPVPVVLDRSMTVGALFQRETLPETVREVANPAVTPHVPLLGQPIQLRATVQGGQGMVRIRWLHKASSSTNSISVLRDDIRDVSGGPVVVEYASDAARFGFYSIVAQWENASYGAIDLAAVRGDVGLTWESPAGTTVEVEPSSGIGYVRGTAVRLRVIGPPGIAFSRWTGDLADRGSENPTVVILNESKHATFQLQALQALVRAEYVRVLGVEIISS